MTQELNFDSNFDFSVECVAAQNSNNLNVKNVAHAARTIDAKAYIVGGRHAGDIARYQFRDGIHQRRRNIFHVAATIARRRYHKCKTHA